MESNKKLYKDNVYALYFQRYPSFSPNSGEFIPEDAPLPLLLDIVDLMELKEIHESYSPSSDGKPTYHPAIQLMAVLFGYMNNISCPEIG